MRTVRRGAAGKAALLCCMLTACNGYELSGMANLKDVLAEDTSVLYVFYPESPAQVASAAATSATFRYKVGGHLDAADLPSAYEEEILGLKRGYLVQGWKYYQNPLSGGTAEQPAPANFELDADDVIRSVTVTAQPAALFASGWEPCTYLVRFDPNGGSGEMLDQAFTYDKEQALSECQFFRASYTFQGWNTSPSNRAVQFTDGAAVTNLASRQGEVATLYAVWSITNNSVQVTSTEFSGEEFYFVYSATVNGLRFIADSKFTSFTWTVDGEQRDTGNTNSFMVGYEDFGAGDHTLYLYVVRETAGETVSNSVTVAFTVG